METHSIEYKQSFNRASIETMVAFANAKGGTIYIGLADDGQVVGVELASNTVADIINEVKSKTIPILIPEVEIEQQEGKTFLKLIVPSFEKVESAMQRQIALGRLVGETPIAFLKKKDLLREDKITNAAFLLFAKEKTVSTTIEMGRFQTSTLIKDDVRSHSDIITQVDELFGFVKKHTPPVTPPVGGSSKILLSDLERQILSTIDSNSSVSRSEMAKLLCISVDTIKQYIKQLRDKGAIRRIGGSSTAGRWEILIEINNI